MIKEKHKVQKFYNKFSVKYGERYRQVYIYLLIKKKMIKEKHKVQKFYNKFSVKYGERYRQV